MKEVAEMRYHDGIVIVGRHLETFALALVVGGVIVINQLGPAVRKR